MKIRLTNFGGVRPAVQSRLLPENLATIAENCRLDDGSLDAWRRGLSVHQLPNVAPQSFYRMYSGGTDYWLAWAEKVFASRGPIPADALFRLYYTGQATPRKTSLALATGSAPYPNDYLEWGLPKPPAIGNITGSGGTGSNITRGYRYTYLTTWGEESQPSDVFERTARVDDTWSVTGLPASLGGKYSIASLCLYRTNGTSAGTAIYQRVATIAIGTTSYNDTIANAALGIRLETVGWTPPPSDLAYMVPINNGIMAGISGNSLCFSEPNRPHAWPLLYQIPMDSAGMGVGFYGNTVVAVTKGRPYVFSGSHPQTMTGGAVNVFEPCLSSHGVVSFPFGVIYPGKTGLTLIGTGGVVNATEGVLRLANWEALNPTTIRAVGYRNQYWATYIDPTTGISRGFVYDRANQREPFVTLSIPIDAFWTDQEGGTLYYLAGGVIYKWDGDPNNRMQRQWRSKLFTFGRPINFGAARISADFTAFSDEDARAADQLANIGYNTTLLTAPESWPGIGNTRGEWGGPSWGGVAWAGSELRGGNNTGFDSKTLNFVGICKGKTMFVKPVTNDKPFKLPDGKGEDWQFEFNGNVRVTDALVAETEKELAS
ncbi:MAG: hypothetical protein ING91_19515 [Rhodocyclaceae bacterium]|nr:hypothetical protein [Rhodocyclaceae bacterium]MCA3848770.1 hypothetical protein [Burkholderia sp.]